jgi:hypothetical protein
MLPAMWWICPLACTSLIACDGDEPSDEPPFTPTGRTASVGHVDASGEILWVAGGLTASGVTDDTLALDLVTGEWTPGPPAGEPAYRAVGTAGGPGGVVFGGTNGLDQESDQVWLWTPGAEVPWVAGSSGPQGRAWHAAAWGDGRLWVHGGRQDDGDVLLFDDLWAYDPGPDVWTEHAVPTGGPGPIYRHGLAWLDGDLWVYGGLDQAGERSQVLWRLMLTEGQWVQQELGLPAPSARASHRLLTVDDALWLWGGDDDESVWTRGADDDAWLALTLSEGPLPREDALLAPTPDGTSVLLFGGDVDGVGAVGDAWRWDVATATWTELSPL